MPVPHDLPPGARIVNYRAETNFFGAVYHMPHCHHAATMYNFKAMPWEKASIGRRAALCCHGASMLRLLCPRCLAHKQRRHLVPVGTPSGKDLVFTCPVCGHEQPQGDADETQLAPQQPRGQAR